jgi:hypothetical protein
MSTSKNVSPGLKNPKVKSLNNLQNGKELKATKPRNNALQITKGGRSVPPAPSHPPSGPKKKLVDPTVNLPTRSNPRTGKILGAEAAYAGENNSQNSFFQFHDRTEMVGGIECRVATFKQALTQLQSSSYGAGLFPVQGYTSCSTVPLSPKFAGGNLAAQSAPYGLYCFKDLSLYNIPGCPTSTDQSMVLAYDPRPWVSPEGVRSNLGSGQLGELYIQALNLASASAGPKWGPVIATAGRVAKLAGEAILNWFKNDKPSSGVTLGGNMFEEYSRANNLQGYLENIQAWIEATASDLGAPAPPVGLPATPLFGDADEVMERINSSIRGIREQLGTSINSSNQGQIIASSNNCLPGSGQSQTIGTLMISGTIYLADPRVNYSEDAQDFGDPLDSEDPNGVESGHQGYPIGKRIDYLDVSFETIVPSFLQDFLVRHGYPRLEGRVLLTTDFEFFHASRLKILKLQTQLNLATTFHAKKYLQSKSQKSLSDPPPQPYPVVPVITVPASYTHIVASSGKEAKRPDHEQDDFELVDLSSSHLAAIEKLDKRFDLTLKIKK